MFYTGNRKQTEITINNITPSQISFGLPKGAETDTATPNQLRGRLRDRRRHVSSMWLEISKQPGVGNGLTTQARVLVGSLEDVVIELEK